MGRVLIIGADGVGSAYLGAALGCGDPRDAITNVVMHRDWFIKGGSVFVEIYTDRIEVFSPGRGNVSSK